MATSMEAERALTNRAGSAIEAGNQAVATELASMAKLFASEHAVDVTDDAIQIHGGSGYVSDHPVERYNCDAPARFKRTSSWTTSWNPGTLRDINGRGLTRCMHGRGWSRPDKWVPDPETRPPGADTMGERGIAGGRPAIRHPLVSPPSLRVGQSKTMK